MTDTPASTPAPDEFLGPEPTEGPRKGRRWGLVTGAAVAVLAAGGVGAWGFSQFLAAGPSAAQAVPADALGYLVLDLDPGAGQKAEAYAMLKKFPALEEKLGLDSPDDLRRWLYEAVLADAGCEVDFDRDIAPWLGGQIGFSAVPRPDAPPAPFGVVEVTDVDKARAGVAVLEKCAETASAEGGEDTTGVAFVGSFMVVAETAVEAERVAASAEAASLADDADYRRWMDEVGGEGIVTGYLAPDAPRVFVELAERERIVSEQGFSGQDPLTGLSMLGMPGGPSDPWEMLDSDEVQKALDDFDGMAMSVRFDDGALEGTVSATMPEGGEWLDVQGDSGIEDLPATTALAVGFPTGEDTAAQILEQLRATLGEDEMAEMEAEAAEMGLDIEEDLPVLLGEGVSLAVDSSLDLSGFFNFSGGATAPSIPVGMRVVGDAEAISDVVDRILEAIGASGQVEIAKGSDAVAFGLDAEYVAELAEDGALGEEASFGEALPGDVSRGAFFVDFDQQDWLERMVAELAEDGALGEEASFGEALPGDVSRGALFVDFDQRDWLERLVGDGPENEEARANVAPLSAFGVSSSVEGDVASVIFRLTTD